MTIEKDITEFLSETVAAGDKDTPDDDKAAGIAKSVAKALKGTIVDKVGPNDLGSYTYHIHSKRLFRGAVVAARKVFNGVQYSSGTCDYFKSKCKTPCQYDILAENRSGDPGHVVMIIDESVSTGRPGIYVLVYDGSREDFNSPEEIVCKRRN